MEIKMCVNFQHKIAKWLDNFDNVDESTGLVNEQKMQKLTFK